MAKNEDQRSNNSTRHRKLNTEEHEPTKTISGDLMCSGKLTWLSRSCYSFGTRHVPHVSATLW